MAPKPIQKKKPRKKERSFSDENNVGFPIFRPVIKKHKAIAVTEWPPEVEEAFLQLIMDELIKIGSQKKCTSYRTWRSFQIALSKKFGLRYKVPSLKEKFNALRRTYCRFLNKLDQEGFLHDRNTNLVIDDECVWLRYIKENPSAEVFREKGCEYYRLLRRIFYKPTPSWESIFTDENVELICSKTLSHLKHFKTALDSFGFMDALTKHLTHHDAIFQLIFVYCAYKMHYLFDPPKMSDDSSDDAEWKMQISSAINTARNASLRLRSVYNSDYLDESSNSLDFTSIGSGFMIFDAKREDNYEICSSASDPYYSLDDCMDVLDAMVGVEAIDYFMAFQRFKNSNCRKKFLFMSDRKRRQWVESLWMITTTDADK